MDFKRQEVKKEDVLKFFGGVLKTAQALEIGEPAVKMWAEKLGYKQAACVLIAAQQVKGVDATRRKWPKFYIRRTL